VGKFCFRHLCQYGGVACRSSERVKDRKLLILPTPPLFEAPARGNPLECRDEIWRQKTRIMGLPGGEEIMMLAFLILTQYRLVTDRRTDRHVAIAITRASIASRW